MAKSSDNLDGVFYQLTTWFLGGGLLVWLATGEWLGLLTAGLALGILKKVFAKIEASGRPLPIFGR